MFKKRNKDSGILSERLSDFSYIRDKDIYLDNACQSMRPNAVINALDDYYKTYNSCGERVKYQWGQQVDKKVESTREAVLNYLSLSNKEYVCSFTLNTTYGLNLILKQIPGGLYEKVVTSDIEHNSVFLSTIEISNRLKIPRIVLGRSNDGSLIYDKNDLQKAIIVVNTTSNIDGRLLQNINQLIKDVHKMGGIIIIDAAQTFAHHRELLANCDADAICFSGHKTYACSIGVIVIKKSLLRSLQITFVGGGMVSEVKKDSYSLLPNENMSSWLEPGLQSWGEIISLGQAIEWLQKIRPNKKSPSEYINDLSQQLYDGLKSIDSLIMINNAPSSTISFYSPKIDSHRLAIFLSASGIMARSGYFCCHYYLLEKNKYPPLLRLSIGLHTTQNDISKTLEVIKKFI